MEKSLENRGIRETVLLKYLKNGAVSLILLSFETRRTTVFNVFLSEFFQNKDKTLTTEFRKEVVNEIINKIFPFNPSFSLFFPAAHACVRPGYDPAEKRGFCYGTNRSGRR
jgi:hypothetical protein